MLFRAFQPQTTGEIKKATSTERSASQIYPVLKRLVVRSRRTPKVVILSMLFGALDYPSPRTEFFLRYAFDGHGYIFSCTVIIFHPQVCAKSLSRGGSARCGLRWLKGANGMTRISAPRGPSTPRPNAITRDKSVRRFAQDDGFAGG